MRNHLKTNNTNRAIYKILEAFKFNTEDAVKQELPHSMRFYQEPQQKNANENIEKILQEHTIVDADKNLLSAKLKRERSFKKMLRNSIEDVQDKSFKDLDRQR